MSQINQNKNNLILLDRFINAITKYILNLYIKEIINK